MKVSLSALMLDNSSFLQQISFNLATTGLEVNTKCYVHVFALHDCVCVCVCVCVRDRVCMCVCVQIIE